MSALEPDKSGGESGWLRRWLPWIFGIATLAAIVFAALHFAEAREFVELAERANGWWLLVACGLQALTYVAQGNVVGAVGRAGRFRLRLRLLYELSLAKLFVEQAIPSSGLSGALVLTGLLERRGMPPPLVGAVIVVDLVSCYAAYVLGLAVALAFTIVHREASAVIVITCVAFSAVAIALIVVALALAGREPGRVEKTLARIRPLGKALRFVADADARVTRSPRVLAEATAHQLAIVLLDAATMGVLVRAVGSSAHAAGVFASFMISTVFRIVGVLPGGLGTFEASSVLTLKMVGVSVAAALSATMLFRALSFWLPMLPGLWLSRRLTKAKPA